MVSGRMAREGVQRSHSFCRLCTHECPIIVDTVDGRAVRVTGDRANPIFAGYTCVKGRAQPELLRNPRRLLTSMKRTSSGSWEPIPVPRAMDEIATRLEEIRDRHGPRAIASYWGTMAVADTTATPFMQAFMKALGSPMRFDPNTLDKPGGYIARALHGQWMAPVQGFDRPDLAFLIGANPLVAYQGMPSGHPGKWLAAAQDRGMKLVVADPRRSDIARRAWLHLRVRPGRDVALLAGMLRVILDEGLHDHAFAAEHVRGVEELRGALDQFDVPTAAAAAGVPEDDLVLAARTFATAPRAYVFAGTGPSMSGHGTLVEYLRLNLVTLSGKVLRAGELVRNPGSLTSAHTFRAQAAPPRAPSGFGEQLRVRGLSESVAGMPTAGLAEEILIEGDGQVRALLSMGGNPLSAWPDQGLTAAAMKRLELLVQIDPWMSQTARYAHYVIAPTMPLETPDVSVVTSANGAPQLGTPEPWAQYTPAVAERPPGSDLIEQWEFFYGLAQRMGLSLTIDQHLVMPVDPFEVDMSVPPTTDQLLEMMTRDARVPLDVVKANPAGVSVPDPTAVVLEKEPGWPHRLDVGNEMMMERLATFAERTDDADTADLPFRLLCRRMASAYNSSHIDAATHRGRLYNPAFMSPDDLHSLGVSSGDLVEITSPVGVVTAMVASDPGLPRGIVSMSAGYGTTPDQEEVVAEMGSAANRLVATDDQFDPHSGQPRMSGVAIDVRPVRPPAARTAAAPTY